MRLFIFLAVISIATPVAAQGPGRVGSVSAVYVRSAGGDEARGQLLRLGPDTLTLLDQGISRDIPLAGITRIDARGDSVKNGAIIGALVLGAYCAIICTQGVGDLTNDQLPYLIGVNIVLGAAIGAGIDAMHVGRTMIYQAGAVTAERRPPGVKATVSRSFRF